MCRKQIKMIWPLIGEKHWNKSLMSLISLIDLLFTTLYIFLYTRGSTGHSLRGFKS